MKLAARDLKKLRWQIAAAAGLIGAAAAIAYLSEITTRQAEVAYRAAASRQGQVDTRLRQVRVEEEEIKNRAALFLQLQEKGILGEEKRLDWTETLRDIQHRMRLPDMTYEFAPQKALEGNGSGDYAFYSSSMKLHLRLLHEEDLLNFLDKVQREAKAMVLTRSCNVARQPAAGPTTSFAQLSAECELDWVTAKKTDVSKQ